MGQVTCLCERRHSRRLLPIEEARSSSAGSLGSGHSILDSNRFEQSLCNVLVQHGLQVTSNIYYNGELEILEDSTALHNARIFILQVHRQGLKHVEEVHAKWSVFKSALFNAKLRAYSRAVDNWFRRDGTSIPPPALGLKGELLYEVDMKLEPAEPGQAVGHDLPQVAVRSVCLDGNQVTTLQRFIQEWLHTPALIEVTLEAVLSKRKSEQIQKQRELAEHLGCKPFLFFNGMEDAKITIDEILPVWIPRENVEHFALRQAQKKAEKVQAAEARALAAENALRQLQGWVSSRLNQESKTKHFSYFLLSCQQGSFGARFRMVS